MKNKSDKETFKLKKNPKRKKKEKDSNSSRDSLELTIKSYQENSKINQENMESGESIKFFFNEFPINKNKSSTATSNKRYQNNIKKEKEEFDFKELLLNYVNQTGRANDKKSKHDERGSIIYTKKNEVLTLNGENNNTNNNDEFSNQISESSSENNMSKSKSLKSLSESSSEKKTEKEEINKKIKEKKKNKEKINKKITKNENNIKTVIKPKSNILINQKEKIKYNEEKLTPIKQVKIFTDKKMMNSEKNVESVINSNYNKLTSSSKIKFSNKNTFTTATNTQDSSFKSLQLDFKKKNYDYLNFSDLSKKKKLIIQNRINSGKRNLKKEENSKEKDEKNIKIKNIGDNLFDKIRNLNISLEVEKSYSIYFSRIINLQNQKINSKNSTDKIQKDINKESKSTYSNYTINKRYYYYPDEYYIDKNSNLHSKSHVSNLFDKLRKKN